MSGTKAELPFDLVIENTIFVSENGDDSTGERGNWNLPFRTLNGAKSVAQAGDCVYVYAGNYNEFLNYWVVSDVHYYFEPNALVQGYRQCISDEDGVKNIYIYGQGTFQVLFLDFTRAVVDIRQDGSTIYFRGKELIGRSNGCVLRGLMTYDIEFDECSVTEQYTIGIYGNCEGRMKFNLLRATSTGAVIQARSLATDGLPHEHLIEGGVIDSNTSAFNSGQISQILNNPAVRIEYRNITFKHSSLERSASQIYLWNSGNAYFNNCSGFTDNSIGIHAFSGVGTALFHNCNLVAGNLPLLVTSDIQIEADTCQFISNNDTDGQGGAVAFSNNAQLDLSNCLIVQNSPFANRKAINVASATSILRIRNCKIIGNPLNTYGVATSSAGVKTIYVEGQCVSNRPTDLDIANGIAGTNIVVDPNVARNTNNFYS